MNVIESMSREETRLKRGRRQRKERRQQWGLLTVTALTAFSTTILVGHENTRVTHSLFAAEVANASTVGAAADFCAEERHRNGDKHKPHPPGNGYGHCKPHDNNGGGNGNGSSVTEEIPVPQPEESSSPAQQSSMSAPADVLLQHSTPPPALA
ncbi:hypothetical protein [Tumebacillus sp. BK434]|uniref:hypothetical protein n=1 Tax=Tumebacillus sp. BK434 TaxID=2512169 RepID=UPI00104678BC|nr:hypothetical protein [Tumebacillus sp. BK434]